MKTWGALALSLVLFLASYCVVHPAKAMINAGGGIWCAGQSWNGETLIYFDCWLDGGFIGDIGGGGGGENPPPGNGGGPPPNGGNQAPAPPDLSCIEEFMANNFMAKEGPVEPSQLWAFGKPLPDGSITFQYSTQSSEPPAGYRAVEGDTAKTPPHAITIYAGGYSEFPGPITYHPVDQPGATYVTDWGSVTALE